MNRSMYPIVVEVKVYWKDYISEINTINYIPNWSYPVSVALPTFP